MCVWWKSLVEKMWWIQLSLGLKEEAEGDFPITVYKLDSKVWVFSEGHKIWKKSSSYFWQERRVLCAQQRTCQKVEEDFSKQMWSSRIIQTLICAVSFILNKQEDNEKGNCWHSQASHSINSISPDNSYE